MQRQSILISAIIGLFLLAWWVGYSILGQMDFEKTTSTAPVVTPTNSSRSSENPTPRVRTPERTERDEPVDTREGTFDYTGWRIDNSADQPVACFEFSNRLDRADGLELVDYVRTEPEAKLTAQINGNSMCLSGLSFGTDYTLTLLKGLKSVENTSLTEDEVVEITLGNRPPYIAFSGDGIILPRVGAQGLAIETVNIDEIELEVFRVGDRIIARRNPDTGQITAEGDYSYSYQNAGTTVREEIWKGTVPVKSLPNTRTTTVFALNEVIDGLKPGAYVVTASRPHSDDEYNYANAWRWIISTDLALTSYRSQNGLDVTVRSIDTAEPVRKTKLELIAENNDLLGVGVTDNSGRVRFDAAVLKGKGVNQPRMLMAYGVNGDFAILDFNRSPLDLSAFPIGGRRAAQKIDAYVFPDRGVYRPGETMHLTAMLRDKFAHAVDARDGHIRILKPNGVEFRKIKFSENSGGTVLQDFEVPASAPRGVWNAHVEIDGMGVVGRSEFSVEDFVPQKLKVDVKIDNDPMRKDEIRPLEISAQFLYGANGSGLEAEGEARIRVDPNPFPDLKGYTFGRDDDDFRELLIDLGGGTTDGKGILELGLSLKGQNVDTSHPLRAEISVGASEPGGRYVKNSTRIPVRTQDVYLGIKPDFKSRAERNKPANFNIKSVDWQGNAVSVGKVEWTLVREDWHYSWYRRSSRWQYRRESRDIEVSQGVVDVITSDGANVRQTLNWGRYRLIVKDPASDSVSAHRFSVGWGGASTSDAPDEIQIGVADGEFESGDTVKLTVDAPYAGIGELVIADDQVRQVNTVQIPQGGSEIDVKLGKDIGAGVYAMLSVYTPRTETERPIPRRAVGIGYISADTSAQRLDVKINAPEVSKPRQKQTLKFNVGNIPRGEKAWLMKVYCKSPNINLLTRKAGISPRKPSALKCAMTMRAFLIRTSDRRLLPSRVVTAWAVKV